MDVADRIVVALAAGQAHQIHVRMSGQEPDELTADVAGRTDDPDADPAWPAGRVESAQGP